MLEEEVGCLFGPKGRRDRNERKAGMPEGVLGAFDSGEGDKATERFSVLVWEMLLVDGRRADGIAEGKALRAGMDGVWGERRVAMLEAYTLRRERRGALERKQVDT